jgi:hypothetical protein
MNEQINIEQIYRQERQRWLREEAPRKSVRDRILDSFPVISKNVNHQNESSSRSAVIVDDACMGE